jgi:predicted Zn-dependent protease
LIAEELISQIKQRYPKEADSPGTVLTGLTDGDMYIRSNDWQFAFSYRDGGRLGVISAARMDPQRFQERADPELLKSRVRKMLTKGIGIMYFNRTPSDDPRSMLYGNILGLEELDAMGEDF